MPGKKESHVASTRRKLLKNIGTGSAGLAGFAGAVTAQKVATSDKHLKASETRRLESKYDNFDTVQQALRSSGAGVKDHLDAEGFALAFELDELEDVRAFVHYDDVIPTGHIVATYDDGPRRVEFHTLPEVDRSFAFVKDGDFTQRFDDSGATIMKECGTDTYCSDSACSCSAPTEGCTNCYHYVYTERCCTYADGSIECEITDSECFDRDCCDDCYCL